MTTTAAPSLWRHRDFGLLWAGQTVSQLGTTVTYLALPLVAILTLHATAFEVGALSATTTAAFLLVGLPAGALVDRLPRRPVLVAADVGRAVLYGSVPVAGALHVLTLAQLYVVALLAGVLTVFFDVGYQSYLPALVPREQLVEGNARLAATAAAARVSGNGVGGALVGLFGAATTVTLDAVSYVVSVASLLAIRGRERVVPRPAHRPTLRHDIREGLGYVLRHPLLAKIAGRTATANLGGGITAAVGTLYMVRGLDFRPSLIGAVFAVGGVGGFLGASASGRLSARLGLGPAMLAGTGLSAAGALAWPLAAAGPAAGLLVAGQVLTGLGVPLYNVTQVSLRQAITPDHLLGRMNATMRFLVWGTLPLGGLVGGALGGGIGLRPTLAVGAGVSILSGVWLLASPVPRIRTVDDAAPRPRGTGPGPITPDGCAVELYAALPPRGEPEIVGGVVPPPATILELGCGAGRLTRPLVAAGYRVTAVDESAEMLERLPGEVERVRSTIEALDLGRRFDAVLLASHLVNTPDAGQRHRLLDCCARHVAPGGVVLVERHPPGWVATVTDAEDSDGALATSLRVLARPAPGLVSAVVTYHLDARTWTHTFTAADLDDTTLAAALDAVGLRLDHWADDSRCWAVAVPAAQPTRTSPGSTTSA